MSLMNTFVEIETISGKPFKPRRDKITPRTEKEFPVLRIRPMQDFKEASSTYYGRLLTWEITGKQTKHLQKNLQIIVDFLNEEWELDGENEIIGNSAEHANFRLWTSNCKLIFDLKKGKYDRDFFLENVKGIIGKSITENSVALPQINEINEAEKTSEKMELIESNYLSVEKIEIEEEFISIEQIEFDEPIFEGAKRTITVDAYERNPQARKKCIEEYGARCSVCQFDFNKFYGEQVAQSYIHVHHLKPLAEIGEEYEVNPIKDLRPVCPNCHAMIHRKNPPYSIEEIKEFIENQNLNDNRH